MQVFSQNGLREDAGRITTANPARELQAGLEGHLLMLAELAMFGRYARGLRGYFRETISLEQAKDQIRGQLQRREQSLLH